MKSHSFRTKAQHSHVLNKNGINTCFSQIAEHLFHLVQFFLVKNGIDRHIYLGPKGMGIGAQLPNILKTITCSSTGTEVGRPNIDSIGTVVDSRDATR